MQFILACQKEIKKVCLNSSISDDHVNVLYVIETVSVATISHARNIIGEECAFFKPNKKQEIETWLQKDCGFHNKPA